MNWILGGASFGSNYGVSNDKETTQKEVASILGLAREFQWYGVDTAPVYGTSEEFLGRSSVGSLAVFSKFAGRVNSDSLRDSVAGSLTRLKVRSLEGLTFHNSKELIENFQFFSHEIAHLRSLGLISSWGVSVYSPLEIVEVLRVASPDYFQAPVSLLDRRFLDSHVNQQIKDSGAKLQARSIFLQGLLANPIDSLPSYFDKWKGGLRRAEQVALENGSDLRGFALDFIRSQSEIFSAVIGIHSPHQMQEVCMRISSPASKEAGSVLDSSNDKALIDPRLWFN